MDGSEPQLDLFSHGDGDGIVILMVPQMFFTVFFDDDHCVASGFDPWISRKTQLILLPQTIPQIILIGCYLNI